MILQKHADLVQMKEWISFLQKTKLKKLTDPKRLNGSVYIKYTLILYTVSHRSEYTLTFL